MATYNQIRYDVFLTCGRQMQNCWIAHVKELNGLCPRPAANRETLKARKKPCPDDARPLIEASLRRFGMIGNPVASPCPSPANVVGGQLGVDTERSK